MEENRGRERDGTGGIPSGGFSDSNAVLDVALKAIQAYGKEVDRIRLEHEKNKKEIKSLRNAIKGTEDSVKDAELRSIETVGIISAIIALVLVFVDTANAQRDLMSSYFILVTATSTLVLFAALLHHFFNRDLKGSNVYYFSVFCLPILVIVSIGIYIMYSTNVESRTLDEEVAANQPGLNTEIDVVE